MQDKINNRVHVFATLGDHMRQTANALRLNNRAAQKLPDLSRHLYRAALRAAKHNPWFNTAEIARTFDALSDMLRTSVLEQWVGRYPGLDKEINNPRTVSVIMAGNIPLVGFHDMLCVLMSGHRFSGKLSNQDKHLPVAVADVLTALDASLGGRIEMSARHSKKADAVIATGSNNSARYFEYYFSNTPHIIRKNRNSAALLGGNESTQDLERLGMDVFSYYGKGCRNVSLLLLPGNFDLPRLLKAWELYRGVLENKKFLNNLLYYKAFLNANGTPFADAGHILLRKNPELASPLPVLHYWFYKEFTEAAEMINKYRDRLQCVVCKHDYNLGAVDRVAFGKTQYPTPWDYADGIDTMQFLLRM